MNTAALGSSLVRSTSGGAQMVHRTSTGDREVLAQLREEAERLHAAPPRAGPPRHLGHPPHVARTRRRQRSQLLRLLAAALVVAFLTGTTSYRMHMAMRKEQQAAAALDADGYGDGTDDQGLSSSGALSGLRSWLGGSQSRRSLREGLTGADTATDTVAGLIESTGHMDSIAGALGVQLFDQWWLLGGDGALPPAEQHPAGSAYSADGAAYDADSVAAQLGLWGADDPMQQVLQQRRLHPQALRVYDFRAQGWLRHNFSKFSQEVPLARWAVAPLPNKAKKKESVIFLAGGYAAPAEADRHPPGSSAGGSGAAAGNSGAAAAAACPLASAGVFSLNTGRNRVRPLPPLPVPCYGAAAVVAGARLHVFGGWATPDRAGRLAVPAEGHWSIGLNADGTSAPEWQHEGDLPPALLGRPLTSLALIPEEGGEPAIYVWAGGSSCGSTTGGSSGGTSGGGILAAAEAACRGAPSDLGSVGLEGDDSNRGGRGGRVALWSFAGSTGWQQRGHLPQPLGDDLQCAVAATPHQLLAVGAVERSGLFSHQRGVWEYDARGGGTWMRAGWAPVEFRGHLCAIHHGRLFVSAALPPLPPTGESAEELALEEQQDLAAEEEERRESEEQAQHQQQQYQQQHQQQLQLQQQQQQQEGLPEMSVGGEAAQQAQQQQAQRELEAGAAAGEGVAAAVA